MIKPGTEWISKQFTDVWSRQHHGTLHGYDYFENQDGTWIYNISFHTEGGCFGEIQLIEQTNIPVEEAIEKARERFWVTKYVAQPYCSD